ncbi:cache domain-containing sensor histidine kinase [Paenibacillus qinlingensis]|uniref:cache domain-containing sensor histidine kinase n=1 Tax=Paenibacillus qinlingensis TaxID=1837343 RepID=UPI001566F303|nr:sensor histidine kinase [Paenibacillus qinlingensis]NQX63587.1 sensor histidine kinase [Paenibacillus qinlingensis]
MASNPFKLHKSIFAKFTLSFISVGLIPLLILSYISLQTFSGFMERYAMNNYEQMLLFASRNVDDMFVKYNNISKLMYSYGVGGQYGQLGQAIAAQSKEKDIRLTMTINDFLQTVLYTDRNLQSVFFVLPNGTFQNLSKNNVALDYQYQYPRTEWKEEMLLNRNGLNFIPTHKQDYFLGATEQVMTFGRNLTDVLGSYKIEGDIVGTFYMDVGLEVFNEIFKQMVLNNQDTVYVVDKQGIILYSNKIELIGTVFKANTSDDFLHLQQATAENNIQIVGEFYKKELFLKVEQLIRTITFVIGLCILSLIVVAVWFSNRFSNPIRSITREMAKVESGNFDTHVTVKTADELGLLSHGFNKMVGRLKEYIDVVYVAQIKLKQAELNALKSQIRPHYLYNTLEVIRMNAVAEDANEVGDMILSLSHQLKYVLDYGEETVAIRAEKANVEQYFQLMIIRYGEHRLGLDFRFDADLMDCGIPKLSLQPIVENAIYHGIMPKSGKGTVRISIEKLPDNLLSVTVDDDGVGMSEETLELVRQKLANSSSLDTGSNIGLINVHERLRVLYGQNFGVEINSSQHIGTTVRLVIPLTKEVSVRVERHSS